MKRERERAGSREETKRRSAPHESLIESIHGDSGEKIARSEIRMAGGVRGSGAKVCRVVTTRYSRTRTLKSSIPEEREGERVIHTHIKREKEKGGGGHRRDTARRERGKIRPPNLYAIPGIVELRVSRIFSRSDWMFLESRLPRDNHVNIECQIISLIFSFNFIVKCFIIRISQKTLLYDPFL